jgi:hypothetical protein
MFHIMSFYSSVYSFCRVLVFNRNCAADINLLLHKLGKFAIRKQNIKYSDNCKIE